jgi:rhamnose utilization protein RhaD (predicted bifunctional aldolase and dehydrogenase)/NAD(P)-dependent dehydrogenase (short-subunit alcohol dehydrogenase family)
MPDPTPARGLKHLRDLWDEQAASRLGDDELARLRYRSNLLGSDRRITNYGGGNTSAKFMLPAADGSVVRVLAVKGSGGDLGTIESDRFAVLDLARVEALRARYRGEACEDETVPWYPRASVANHGVAPSIDTPLHAFLPFDHVDHLHPDWAIALAASANGRARLDEFNRQFDRRVVWVPWQRPGFELALMLRQAVDAHPGCDAVVLGSHGLFTWGPTSHDCYLNTITLVDEIGEFVLAHQRARGARLFGGAHHAIRTDRGDVAVAILPVLRGELATTRRSIGVYDDDEEVLAFVNAADAPRLAAVGTSCPDHFVRTRIRPLWIDWDPARGSLDDLRAAIAAGAARYRDDYSSYYHAFAQPTSPPLRDANPSVVLVPGIGMFTFGASRREARITGEFYRNAIRVMAGATSLGEATGGGPVPQARRPEDAAAFTVVDNYVALPPREAFRIEYWLLEDAKLRRLPLEKEFARRIFLVIGGGSGIGRATAVMAASRGAHVMIADRDEQSAAGALTEVQSAGSAEAAARCGVDITSRTSVRQAMVDTIARFGGLDVVVNTAAVFMPPDLTGRIRDEAWQRTLDVNVTGTYLVADEASSVLAAQRLPAALVLTSSANAVVPKRGSEAYDVSKSAVNHLVRELAVRLAPLVRVNAIAPATVVHGSTMFPRERVMASLAKYGVVWDESESTDALRAKLAGFYARRTLLGQPISPEHCAEAICWLAGDRGSRTTGHVLPVDGGLPEAFLR